MDEIGGLGAVSFGMSEEVVLVVAVIVLLLLTAGGWKLWKVLWAIFSG